MALSPRHLAQAITGMKALSKNGLRYPIAPYGIQSDVRAGMGVPMPRIESGDLAAAAKVKSSGI